AFVVALGLCGVGPATDCRRRGGLDLAANGAAHPGQPQTQAVAQALVAVVCGATRCGVLQAGEEPLHAVHAEIGVPRDGAVRGRENELAASNTEVANLACSARRAGSCGT